MASEAKEGPPSTWDLEFSEMTEEEAQAVVNLVFAQVQFEEHCKDPGFAAVARRPENAMDLDEMGTLLAAAKARHGVVPERSKLPEAAAMLAEGCAVLSLRSHPRLATDSPPSARRP